MRERASRTDLAAFALLVNGNASRASAAGVDSGDSLKKLGAARRNTQSLRIQ
jgi:hypothetical protein